MRTRIIAVSRRTPKETHAQWAKWYVPQWTVDGKKWMEFIGYDIDSPYLTPIVFKDFDEAKSFLASDGVVYAGGTDFTTKTVSVSVAWESNA